jgi:peptidoglycan/LPS O-acetylase OafA/YrhL
VNLVLAFGLAALSYRFVDAPLQKLGHRLAARVKEPECPLQELAQAA